MHAGADVLIEKPAAASIQEVNLMLKCENLTRKRVYVGFQHIYQRCVQDAKRMFLDGRLGRLETFIAEKNNCICLSTGLYYDRYSDMSEKFITK